MAFNEWHQKKEGKQSYYPRNKKLLLYIYLYGYFAITKQNRTIVDQVASIMTFNRFTDISQMLHYNDNNTIPGRNSPDYNRCYKIQPVINHFRACFTDVVVKETFLSVDKQVVPFKGRSGLKRYLKNKPKKWGYKLWAIAGKNGYVYDFEVDGMTRSNGPPAGTNPPNMIGESGYVVLRLTKTLEPNLHKVFFDNYFNSPELLQYLGQKKIWAVGTLNKKRLCKCPIKTDKVMKENGHRFSEECISKDKTVVVIPWYDNKTVLTMSNYFGKAPVTQCQRWDKKNKETISIDRPASVTVYNKFMGGVDKSDMMLALYRTRYWTRKWYQRIVTQLFSQACVNSWVIHRSLHETVATSLTYIEFLQKKCQCLMSKQRTVDSDDEEDLLFDSHRVV